VQHVPAQLIFSAMIGMNGNGMKWRNGRKMGGLFYVAVEGKVKAISCQSHGHQPSYAFRS
jgi:hypothetical protein